MDVDTKKVLTIEHAIYRLLVYDIYEQSYYGCLIKIQDR